MNTGRPEAGAHYAALYNAAQARIAELEGILQNVADTFDGGPEHPWIPGYNAKPIYQPVMDAVKGVAPREPVAEVVSGYSGDPDSRGSKQIKALNLAACPVGTKLYP